MTGHTSVASFVGRAAELRRLEQAWEAALSGQPQLVLVAGEAGIGKTRLAKEFAGKVIARGGKVLWGECLDLREGGLPYGPIRQALRALRTAGGTELTTIRAAAQGVLADLMPELDHGTAAAASTPRARVRLFESLLELFQRLAEHQPLLVVVDDVHWSDHATLDLLTFLARNLSAAPIVELLTFRDDEVGRDDPLLGFLYGRGSGTVSDRVELARLGEHEVAAQIADLVEDEPPPSLVHEIFERSDGNPLFVEELLANRDSGPTDIPPELNVLLSRRLIGIDPLAQHVLRVASVAGHVVTYEVLRAVIDLGEEALLQGLRAAVDAGLVRVDPVSNSYTFRHALLQEAIRDQLLPSESRALHRSYAETLSKFLSDEPQLAGGIAAHWDQAGEADRALVAYVEAAGIAERSYAYAEAERCLRRASELWDEVDEHSALAPLDKVELLSRAVDAAVLMEEPARGVPLARAALRELEHSDDISRSAKMQAQLARTLWYSGQVDDGLQASALALRQLSDTASHGAAFAAGKRASQLAVLGHYQEAEHLAAGAIAMAEQTGAWWTRLSASITHASVLARLKSIDDGLRLLDVAAQDARQRGVANDLMRSYLYRGRILEAAARWEDARRCYAEGMLEAPKYGMDRRYVWRFQTLAARMLFLQGHWQEAAGLIAHARERGSRALLQELAVATGDFEAADRYFARERSKWRSDGSGGLQQPEGPVDLAIWRGQFAAARSRCEQSVEQLGQSDEPLPLARLCVAGLRGAADQAATLGAGDRASQADVDGWSETLLQRLLDLWHRFGVHDDGRGRELQALAMTGLAERSRIPGPADPAGWEAAADMWSDLSLPYPTAYARFRLGETLLEQSGAREEAAVHLRAAAASATLLGAEPLRAAITASARRARIELDRSGADGDANAFQAWAADRKLTAREQQVIRLITEGRSNREIGEHLYIAESTASVHVSHILRKLNVRTRAEVIPLVLRSGLLD